VIWHDVLLDRKVEDREIEDAVASAFEVPNDEVRVVHLLSDAPPRGEITILCVCSWLDGDFPLLLSIYVFGLAYESRPVVPVVQGICRDLDCTCLVSDSSPDPYQMLLLEGQGEPTLVELEVSELDDDRYVLASSGPKGRRDT